jgi:hypothetical protein
MEDPSANAANEGAALLDIGRLFAHHTLGQLSYSAFRQRRAAIIEKKVLSLPSDESISHEELYFAKSARLSDFNTRTRTLSDLGMHLQQERLRLVFAPPRPHPHGHRPPYYNHHFPVAGRAVFNQAQPSALESH